jgi:formylglycine-generating enzyme required for sulfatase activity
MRRLGLVLPTEGQWEYGARATTTSAYWCGQDSRSVHPCDAGNLFDKKTWTWRVDTRVWGDCEPWEDDHPGHATVGSYAANGFGLHDVIGNVWEWCEDLYLPYQLPVREGDGLRIPPDTYVAPNRVNRGASFNNRAAIARHANRSHNVDDSRDNYLGVRPARRLDPARER